MSEHLGVSKNVQNIKQKCYWYRMAADIKLHIKSCKECCQNRRTPKHRAPLKEYQVGFHRVGIDAMGPLPITDQGKKYLLVIGNYFTRWVEPFPLKDLNFDSTLFKEICKILQVKKTRTILFHPQSNGMI